MNSETENINVYNIKSRFVKIFKELDKIVIEYDEEKQINFNDATNSTCSLDSNVGSEAYIMVEHYAHPIDGQRRQIFSIYIYDTGLAIDEYEEEISEEKENTGITNPEILIPFARTCKELIEICKCDNYLKFLDLKTTDILGESESY